MSEQSRRPTAERIALRALIAEATAATPPPPPFTALTTRARHGRADGGDGFVPLLLTGAGPRCDPATSRAGLHGPRRWALAAAAAVVLVVGGVAVWAVSTRDGANLTSADGRGPVPADEQLIAFNCLMLHPPPGFESEQRRGDEVDSCIAASDGSGQRTVAENVWGNFPSAPSPDGRWLAVVERQEAAPYLVMDLDGRVEATIDGAQTWPSWTPDSRSLVFTSERSVVVALIDGSAATEYELGDGLVPRGLIQDRPEVAPDGSRVALAVARLDEFTSDSIPGGHVAILDLDSGQVTLLDHVPDPSSFSWSPDGGRLAVTSPAGLVVVDTADGGAARSTLHQGGDLDGAAWSPDGQTIAFVDHRSSDQRRPSVVVLLDVATGATRTVGFEDFTPASIGLNWSSDSSSVALAAFDTDSGRVAEVFVVDRATGQVRMVTSDQPDPRSYGSAFPTWIPQFD
jgi:Tol biopolymer transport system component